MDAQTIAAIIAIVFCGFFAFAVYCACMVGKWADDKRDDQRERVSGRISRSRGE